MRNKKKLMIGILVGLLSIIVLIILVFGMVDFLVKVLAFLVLPTIIFSPRIVNYIYKIFER